MRKPVSDPTRILEFLFAALPHAFTSIVGRVPLSGYTTAALAPAIPNNWAGDEADTGVAQHHSSI